MLQRLEISNFALVENLEINFQSGFTTITGETGSGKSVMLSALGLLTGNRADSKALKNPEVKCVVKGEFGIKNYGLKIENDAVKEIVEEEDILTIRRVILPSGKSRAYINEEPVKLEDLKLLGGQLVDIHSQHQNLLLRDADFTREVVDLFAGNGALLGEYQKAYGVWRVVCDDLDAVIAQQEQAKAEYDYNQVQLEAFEGLDEELDLSALESEQEIGAHGVEIEGGVREIDGLIDGKVDGLDDVLKVLNRLEGFYEPAKRWKERIESLYFDLQDIKQEVEGQQGTVDLDPERVEYVADTLARVYGLMKRYNVHSVDDLWNIRVELEQKVAMVEDFETVLSEKKGAEKKKKDEMKQLALALSNKRNVVISGLEAKIGEQLSFLGMKDAVVTICNKKLEDGLFGTYGVDQLEFMYVAHESMVPRSLAQIASGGEVARIMLVLKNILADLVQLPTVIFDEVDTGVSGDVADKVGQMMRAMAGNRQVMAISHLPQVAAKGEQQLKVLKEGDAVSAYTRIVALGEEDRVAEIAQMISGSDLSDSALEQARLLLR